MKSKRGVPRYLKGGYKNTFNGLTNKISGLFGSKPDEPVALTQEQIDQLRAYERKERERDTLLHKVGDFLGLPRADEDGSQTHAIKTIRKQLKHANYHKNK